MPVPTMPNLREDQLERYNRHLVLEHLGPEGQARIMQGKVLIIGAGGLGSPVALYLAAAGVGTVGIADSDRVDLSNLHRQIIHHTSDVGVSKVKSAAAKLAALNPDVKVRTHHELVRADSIRELIHEYDFVVDCTDNFAAKFLINDACVLARKPFSHGGVLRFEGQTMTVLPGQGACYRCLFSGPPSPDDVPTCAQAGVMGVVPGMLGTIQAAEALKFLAGIGQLLTDALLVFDALEMKFRKVSLRRRPDCAVCGDRPTILELADEPLAPASTGAATNE
jgi:molybdopterin/thiamine biosynthesis adenylyltransferase